MERLLHPAVVQDAPFYDQTIWTVWNAATLNKDSTSNQSYHIPLPPVM